MKERGERIGQFMPAATLADLQEESIASGEAASNDPYWLDRMNRDYLRS